MSELSIINTQTINDRATWTCDPIKNLRTGEIFAAEIDGNPDSVLVMNELGEDARNVILIHVNDCNAACKIVKGDFIQFRLYGVLATARVQKRRDSAAQMQTDFWCIQKSDKDQT